MKRVFPILGLLTAVLLSYALYEALVVAPTEQTMGNVQRIFYYHVPSAWTAFLLFFINFVCSIQYLVRSNPVADKLTNWTVIAIASCSLHRCVRDPSACPRASSPRPWPPPGSPLSACIS